MNVDRAFERRAKLEARLAAAAGKDFTQPEQERQGCPDAVDRQHGDPNWRGRCPYCDTFLGRKSRTWSGPDRPDVDVEDVIDDVTLSPVAACERADVWREQSVRRFRAGRPA